MAEAAARPRIVSLVPSSTETLLALGADVVACTRFCEQPALAHVGGTKNPDVAAIVALAPDVVVMDEEENRREDADALAGAGFAVLVTDVRDLADVPAVVRRLADAAGVPVPSIEAPVGSATEWASAIVPIWRRPWMLLGPGTYGASVLAALGVDVWSPTGGRYDEVALDDLAAAERADGDLFLLAPTEPYAFREAHLAELAAAAPTATVHVVDGQDLFWWGTRTPGALIRLRAQLRPSL